jgi:antitoxin Phd
MYIKIDSLIPFDTLRTDLEHVVSVVEKNGKVVLLKDNKPAYILLKCDTQAIEVDTVPDKQINYTLQEAMKIVLSEAEDKTMHASKLADEIYERRLYLQKNGNKAQYTQIRARCGHYPDMFEALTGNYIKLRERVKQTTQNGS